MVKKLLILLTLATSSLLAQITLTEEFTAGYSAGWTHQNAGVEWDTTDIITDGYLQATGATLQVNYGYYQYYADSLSTTNSDFDVRGYLWKDTDFGNLSPMLGIWSSTNEYLGIGICNVYQLTKVSLMVRDSTVDGEFKYLFDTGLAVDAKDYFRVTYSSSTDSIKFYYWNSGDWMQLGTTQYWDYGAIQWKVGTFAGAFNATAGTPTGADSLWIQYNPINQWDNIILNYPDAAGLVFREDSVITIHWTAPSDTAIDNTYLAFSTNSGTDWSDFDTVAVADTSVSWTVPRHQITTGKIRVLGDSPTYWADSSANDFTINPFSDIEVYDVSPETTTFTESGGVDSISVRSQYVTSFDLFWSNDSLIWHTIELNNVVDTVNSALWDSTLYVWSIGSTTITGGPTFWIKAEESRDTSSTQDLVNEGEGLNKLGSLFCMNVTGSYLVSDCASGTVDLSPSDGIVNAFSYYDPSCGWSNVTHRLYWHEIAITDTNSWTIAYSNQFNTLTFDRRQCVTTETIQYPIQSQYQIVILNSAGDDSLVITRADATSAHNDSLLYNGWWYSFLTDGTNFYVMGRATNTAVYDTIMNYTDRTGTTTVSMSQDQADHRLAILHFPIDVVIARADSNVGNSYYVTSDLTTMKDYADSLGFIAKIMVGDEGRQQSMYYVTSWEPAPDNNNLAEDVYSTTLSFTMTRNYFRGIHPKINKD